MAFTKKNELLKLRRDTIFRVFDRATAAAEKVYKTTSTAVEDPVDGLKTDFCVTSVS